MDKESYHEECASAAPVQNASYAQPEHPVECAEQAQPVGEHEGAQYQYAGEQEGAQYHYAGEQEGMQYQHAGDAPQQTGMKAAAPEISVGTEGFGPAVRQGAPVGYPGPHSEGGKPEGYMGREASEGHSCSCGEPQGPEMVQPGMMYPGAPAPGPQPGMMHPGAPAPGPQPGMMYPGAPAPGPQPGMMYPGAPAPGPQPGMMYPGMSSMPGQGETEHSHAEGGCGGKKGGAGHPTGSQPGMAPDYAQMDPLHLENRYGQIMAMCNDFMQGKTDPAQVMAFLTSTGTNFWKGALVGAALTFLVTNDGVKSAVRETFSSLGKSQSE